MPLQAPGRKLDATSSYHGCQCLVRQRRPLTCMLFPESWRCCMSLKSQCHLRRGARTIVARLVDLCLMATNRNGQGHVSQDRQRSLTAQLGKQLRTADRPERVTQKLFGEVLLRPLRLAYRIAMSASPAVCRSRTLSVPMTSRHPDAPFSSKAAPATGWRRHSSSSREEAVDRLCA